MGDLKRCGEKVVRLERLLLWVLEEVDLSGHMELVAEIRAILGER